MISRSQRMPGWMFIFGWMGLSVLSLLLTWGLTLVIIKGINIVIGDTILVGGQTRITEDYLAAYVIFILVGFLSGLLQFLFIRKFISRAGWWILATFLGWMTPFGIAKIASLFDPAGWAFYTISAVSILFGTVGGALGLAQWLVLKAQVRLAGWWILISGLAWGLTGLIIGSTISETYDFWVLLLLPALATGLGLWLLLYWLPRREVRRHAPII